MTYAIKDLAPAPAADAFSRFAARYGSAADAFDPAAPERAADLWNPVLDTLLNHRSVRRYAPRPLPEGVLEMLAASAQSAANSSNLQTWSVVAVRSAERKANLAALSGGQKHVAEVPLFLVWVADLARSAGLAKAKGAPAEALDYLESFLVAAIDAALAAQNAVVALESLGLGCVYIGGIRNQPEAVAEALNLPPLCAPILGLCVGWPDPETATAVKPRLPQGAVLHLETYADTLHSHIGAYDHTVMTFQNSQNLPQTGWIPSVLSRIAGGKALNGRGRLREALNSRGFLLR